MKKTLFIMLLMAAVAVTANAVPAKRVTKTVVIDGKEVVLTLKGDESCHYWEAADGGKFMQKADNAYEKISATVLQAMKNSPKKTVRSATSQDMSVQARAKRKVQNTGEKHGLVILVNFKDKTFSSTSTPKATYENIVNGVNYTGSKNHGSVRDYFKAQSYGQLDFNFDIAGPVMLSQNMAYYGANDDSNGGDDVRPGTMIWEACKAVDDEVDFSKYDNDGDGKVDQVFVVYAGYGEAQGGSANTIWPHAWNLVFAAYYEGLGSCVFDGVTVDSYACSCELAGNSGKTMDGIGTICHEFSHCLGLPDFYCTNGSHESMTMDSWSIMDYGCYAGDGYTPVSYTAYERWYSGWVEPTELSKPMNIRNMKNIDTDGECYILYNDECKDEYYILQNIQREGWNSAAPGHGMLILHVDYDATAWHNNTPNNTASNLRMAPICADNKATTNTLSGDTYPGTSRNTSLTDTSAPAAKLFHSNAAGKYYMGKPITDIAEANGQIFFTFDGGVPVEAPTNLTAEYVNGDIAASWTAPAENVASYNIKYGVYDESVKGETVLVDEDFEKCKAAADGNNDIASSLDNYLNIKGFTGYKLYKGKSGMKVSSSNQDGYLKTPLLSEVSGKVKVIVSAMRWKDSESAHLYVNVKDKSDEQVKSIHLSELSENMEIELEVPEQFYIELYANKRLYLSKLQIVGTASLKYAQETLIEGITENPYTFTPAMAADKYWLAVQTVGDNGKTSIWTDAIIIENATAISSLNAKTDNSWLKAHGTYNLAGQKVNANYRGIVIMNGKKVRN